MLTHITSAFVFTNSQIKTLTEELGSLRAERDGLLSEKDADAQNHREETEGLQSRLASISEERDQLQEALESLRQQKQQLQEELEDRMEAVRGHLTFTNDVVVLKPLRTQRDESNVLFSQVAQAHCGFGQPETLQAHDEAVNQHQQEVTAIRSVGKSTVNVSEPPGSEGFVTVDSSELSFQKKEPKRRQPVSF